MYGKLNIWSSCGQALLKAESLQNGVKMYRPIIYEV